MRSWSTKILICLATKFTRNVVLLGLFVLAAYGAWMFLRFQSDPTLPLLPVKTGGNWVVHNQPIWLGIHDVGPTVTTFRTQIDSHAASRSQRLRLAAAREANVLVNGAEIPSIPPGTNSWKEEFTLDLTAYLRPGKNEIVIRVENLNAPPALWIAFDGFSTDLDPLWESSTDLVSWTRVRAAQSNPLPDISLRFIMPFRAFVQKAPLLLLIAFISGLLIWQFRRRGLHEVRNVSRYRYLVMLAWIAMACNNIGRFPVLRQLGFDASAHLDYIVYILQNSKLPLATDGWQMFQSPLYYTLSAGLFYVASKIFAVETALNLLRIIPLLCGLFQIEIAFRVARLIVPFRPGLQLAACLVAACTPMNVYLSHYISNESLSGLLSAVVFLLCVKATATADTGLPRGLALWIGGVLGLALLSKITSILMVPAVFVTIVYVALQRYKTPKEIVVYSSKLTGIVFSVSIVVSGWYYLRNWIYLGRPFVGGWDLQRGISWWQDPGYRSLSDYFTFGHSFTTPIYAGTQSFWDGFYTTFWCDGYLGSSLSLQNLPPWDFGYSAVSVVMAIAPTLLIILGAIRLPTALSAANHGVGAVVFVTVATHVLSVVHLTLTLPYYCAVKAFYTIGALPGYVILAMLGLEGFRSTWARTVIYGILISWAWSVASTYLIR